MKTGKFNIPGVSTSFNGCWGRLGALTKLNKDLFVFLNSLQRGFLVILFVIL